MSNTNRFNIKFTKAAKDGRKLIVGKKANDIGDSLNVTVVSFKSPQERAESEIDSIILFKWGTMVYDLDGSLTTYDKKETKKLVNDIGLSVSNLLKAKLEDVISKFGLDVDLEKENLIFTLKNYPNHPKSMGERLKESLSSSKPEKGSKRSQSGPKISS